MEKIDIKELLERNPHLDPKAVEQCIEKSSDNLVRRKKPKQGQHLPFGNRQAEERTWSEADPAQRPYYRAM